MYQIKCFVKNSYSPSPMPCRLEYFQIANRKDGMWQHKSMTLLRTGLQNVIFWSNRTFQTHNNPFTEWINRWVCHLSLRFPLKGQQENGDSGFNCVIWDFSSKRTIKKGWKRNKGIIITSSSSR